MKYERFVGVDVFRVSEEDSRVVSISYYEYDENGNESPYTKVVGKANNEWQFTREQKLTKDQFEREVEGILLKAKPLEMKAISKNTPPGLYYNLNQKFQRV